MSRENIAKQWKIVSELNSIEITSLSESIAIAVVDLAVEGLVKEEAE